MGLRISFNCNDLIFLETDTAVSSSLEQRLQAMRMNASPPGGTAFVFAKPPASEEQSPQSKCRFKCSDPRYFPSENIERH